MVVTFVTEGIFYGRRCPVRQVLFLLLKQCMNVKRSVGILLSVAGTGGLIYASILLVYNEGGVHALLLYTVGGLALSVLGTSLVWATKDEQ